MELNNSATAKFHILAKTDVPIDAVIRHAEKAKLEFPATASLELGFSEKYGYQLILVAYGSEGKFPILIQTDYSIARPRIEIPIPSAYTLAFLKDLNRNVKAAIAQVKEWERMRLRQ